MIKDYLGRELAIDDHVIFMAQHYRELRLAKISAFTPSGKARISWGDNKWQTLLQTGAQLVKVEGPELTYFLLNQKG